MKTVWKNYDSEIRGMVNTFADEYRSFLDRTKTEREFVNEALKLAKESGFCTIEDTGEALKPGDRIYAVNRGKNLALFVIGEKPLTEGFNLLCAHIDSPRLDLKQNPLYEKEGFAMLDTHYYGGIKNYQWVTRPMALHGVVVKKDGTMINVVIGEDADDPVVAVSDILVHLAKKQLEKKASEAIEGEQLNLIAGSIPGGGENEPVKNYLLALLKERYGMEEDDFLSAEIEAVPAEKARNFGIDNSMIMGYGQDDRICAYTSLRAILDMKIPERTSCLILTEKEEIGSVGATGMNSRWFENMVIALLDRIGKADLVHLNQTLSSTLALSSDVSAGVDPNFTDAFETKNAAYLGRGIVFNKYLGARGKSGCNDASPEFIARIRNLMDSEHIMFQTAELGKVDLGGGGTISKFLAHMNIEVIDAGLAVLNMHAPGEISSKADLYEGYRAYKAFLDKI